MPRWRHLSTSEIQQLAQSDNFEITGVGGGSETWTWTLALDNGDTFTETFVDDGSPTLTEITAGVVAALNNSNNPYFQLLTATDNDPNAVVTSNGVGIPFNLALAASGTGAITKTSLVANAGINDFQFSENWDGSAVPGAADDVIFEAGGTDVLYRLDLSGTALGDFVVEPGCTSNFGRLQFGEYLYLEIDPDLFDFRGSGRLCLFDLGSANIPAFIAAGGGGAVPGQQGIPAVFIKGGDLTTLEIAQGNVGVAWLFGDTATVDTILSGSMGVQGAQQSQLFLGSGLTLSTALSVLSGTAVAACAIPTATVAKGATLTTEGTNGITTKLNCFGTVFSNSSGTIAEADVSGVLDFTADRTPRTISLLNPRPGGRVRRGSWITVTAWGDGAGAGNFVDEWVD